ncbi:hypothetical protein CN918_32575 [Priestia megaterium]|nr:hypothetical protein CN918_32575 [Priestia megaterium]
MSKNIEKVAHNVKILVESEPEVKDCYNLLVTRYWAKFELAVTLRDSLYCTPAETITRSFRSLVKTGEIELGEVTRARRREKRKEFHKHFAKEVQRK